MEVRELRRQLGATQSEFARRYNIPFRTVQNWETGIRKPPAYILELLEQRIREDLVNKRTVNLPSYDASKKSLPKRRDYPVSLTWLKAVSDCIGNNVVFALDEALMCHGYFGGRSDEYIIWAYADDTVTEYNGVVLLGNHISPYNVMEKSGIRFTDLNRTLSDAFANEAILDMQGTTEALSKYYYTHQESFEGLSVAPEYQAQFDVLANEAIEYYSE